MLFILLVNVTVLVKKNNIIFGPVLSRRFGKSLGIDLSPSKKQCNFDCLYCELKPAKTVDSYSDILSIEDIITALKAALIKHQDIDVITLTANGEPTLYPYLNELIDEIDKIKGDIKTLILSNGATIDKTEVQKALLKLDTVKLSLDCANMQCLKKLDRPSKNIDIENIKRGMLAFKEIYNGALIIEILFVKDINDDIQNILGLNEYLLRLQPSRIDIGSIDRPPAYDVKGLQYEELLMLSKKFDKSLPIYIVSRKNIPKSPQSYSDNEILATLNNRPLTGDDMEILFDDETMIRVKKLLSSAKLKKIEKEGIVFYTLT
ncbi:MAG: radical SAM protein [Campylobacterales bacterium]|nr:radical SAM protein [Campylobacterales bacterium]